jgi:ammonium transporter, Amt family
MTMFKELTAFLRPAALAVALTIGMSAGPLAAWAQPAEAPPAATEATPAPTDAAPPADAAPAPEAAPAAEAPAEAEIAPPAADALPAHAKKTELNTGDTAWMLTSTALVLLMTVPGLALFYAGMVRKKNLLATAAQSFAITALVTVLWAVIGYSLAFTNGGDSNAVIGGLDRFMLAGMGIDVSHSLAPSIPESVFMTFQMTFAIITPALICGAFADRMKFSALMIFTGAWVLLVYAPVAHWVWGGGFLGGKGVLDFAGGTVVHWNAGIAGLICAIVLGKRVGYGTENMAPHNLLFALIGASLLWVGWFGFNAGSAVAANGLAGMAMANTQIAAGAAALSWTIVEWIVQKKPSLLGMISGAVAGLVAITPAAGFVAPDGALYIGLIAGPVCYLGAVWLKRALGYDDSLDAFGVHGVGGATGAILTGVFAVPAINSLGTGMIAGNAYQVWLQIEGLLYAGAYCAIVTFAILMIIQYSIGLRVSRDEELEGLDITQHGEKVH